MPVIPVLRKSRRQVDPMGITGQYQQNPQISTLLNNPGHSGRDRSRGCQVDGCPLLNNHSKY